MDNSSEIEMIEILPLPANNQGITSSRKLVLENESIEQDNMILKNSNYKNKEKEMKNGKEKDTNLQCLTVLNRNVSTSVKETDILPVIVYENDIDNFNNNLSCPSFIGKNEVNDHLAPCISSSSSLTFFSFSPSHPFEKFCYFIFFFII
jgi:hypothetical protein